MGCAKTVCPSSGGNNGAFVNEIRLDICRNQFKCIIVIVSVTLLFQSLALHYFFLRVCEPLFH